MLIAYGIYKFRTFKQGLQGMGGAADILAPKKFKAIEPENIKIHFSDVAGMHEAKF